MRYLNKIIFINSAHIPYAEVKLDGNVHFIGTQGVGKSTVLRALLFFYNAEKTKLGIPTEKKGFDNYYFPYVNSYIVYEVMREHGAYCVVAAKSQGRTFFRFVDTPFCRNWFVDEKGEAYSEFGRIREHIGNKVSISNQVTSYEQYRDIIFGNNRRPELVAFRKYALVESSKYQNIPRTIQNVFLNSKLEADFIKDTIIRSMNDEEAAVDLSYYRGQIGDFEQEYKDVMKWFETNKQGEVIVRKQAEKVMTAYRNLLYQQQQIKNQYAELNYAEREALHAIPQVKEEIAKEVTEQERFKRLAGEEEEKYNKERDKLKEEQAVVENNLKRCRDKQTHYEQIRINEIISRVAREEDWLREQKQVSALRTEVTQAYQDVIGKYQLLASSLETDYRTAKNQSDARIMEWKEGATKQQREWMQQLHAEEERIRTAQDEALQAVGSRLTQLRDEQAQHNLKWQRISFEHPHEKEIKDLKQLIDELQARDKELTHHIREEKTEMNRLREACAWQRKETERDYEKQSDAVNLRKTALENQIKVLDELMAKRKGSFIAWLEQHKPDWQSTIGKVADEEQVLYNNSLLPRLQSGDNTFFGVAINPAAIDRTIRTPEEMRREREALQTELQACTDELKRLKQAEQTTIENLEKQYAKQVRTHADAMHLQEAERTLLPVKRKNAEADLVSWRNKEAEWKRAQTDLIQRAQEETAHKQILAETDKKHLLAERERLLKACRKVFKDKQTALQKEEELFVDEIQQQQAALRKQTDERKRELEQAQANELAGKGADTATINRYDNRLTEIAAELAYIKEQLPNVTLYNRDREEYFAHEQEWRNRRKELEIKLAALGDRYALRKERLNIQQKEVAEKLQRNRTALTDLEKGLTDVEEFRMSALFDADKLAEVGEQETRKGCIALVNELKQSIYTIRESSDDFKRAVLQFKGNFSEKNTFHFRTELREEHDFFDFASNLCEFVDNDKISEYQRQISERYTAIIQRISKEVGDLTRNESEIQRTINAINNDFVERNFAGVIKEISLRAQPGSDKLMQLLLEIKHFNDENMYNMGVADLFSQASRENVNKTAVRYLHTLSKRLTDEPGRKLLALTDTFKLEFRVIENDNDTGWVEKISNVGSDGTDVLVKAMVNIMLINVFKEGASRKFSDFKLHCMMDEIGKLHPNNVKGILEFANARNILLVNSSPTTYNVESYRYTYLLTKDGHAHTQVIPLLTNNQNNRE
ncbi:MAG: ATP-binding protein [Prevotellaceae bacterium]|jgi:hypothetical protein|nr:ATP-binding protein [Prevotellaceae bacterium]